MDTVICPNWPSLPGIDPADEVSGCGKAVPDVRDDEGLVDCPECGIWFNPDLETQPQEGSNAP